MESGQRTKVKWGSVTWILISDQTLVIDRCSNGGCSIESRLCRMDSGLSSSMGSRGLSLVGQRWNRCSKKSSAACSLVSIRSGDGFLLGLGLFNIGLSAQRRFIEAGAGEGQSKPRSFPCRKGPLTGRQYPRQWFDFPADRWRAWSASVALQELRSNLLSHSQRQVQWLLKATRDQRLFSGCKGLSEVQPSRPQAPDSGLVWSKVGH